MKRNLFLVLFSFWLGFMIPNSDMNAWPESNENTEDSSFNPKMKVISSSISVLGETKKIEVVFEKDSGRDEFAKAILNEAERYIPKVAEYLGISPSMDTFRITDLTDGSIARNEGKTVLVPFNYPVAFQPLNNALLYHEISHWWFGQNPRWISEGISSFLPLAIAEAGSLKLSDFEKENIHSWWGLKKPLNKKDIPLGDDGQELLPGDYNFAIYYEKSYKIQYILYLELGEKKYKQFLLSLLNPDTSLYPYYIQKNSSLEGTDSILGSLSQIKPKNWKSYFSGWLLKKNYKDIPPDLFNDSDQDGLLDIQEKYLGTNKNLKDSDGDGVSDGTEVKIKTDPTKKTDESQFKKIFSQLTIILDGDPSEWKFFEDSSTVKTTSNPNIPGKYDFLEFNYRIVNGTLYGMFRNREPMKYNEKEDNGLYFFLIDSSEKKETDGFGFWFSPYAAWGWESERKKGIPVMVYGRVNEVFEFQMSLKYNPNRVLRLSPILRPNPKNENIGVWNNYTPIEIEIP